MFKTMKRITAFSLATSLVGSVYGVIKQMESRFVLEKELDSQVEKQVEVDMDAENRRLKMREEGRRLLVASGAIK